MRAQATATGKSKSPREGAERWIRIVHPGDTLTPHSALISYCGSHRLTADSGGAGRERRASSGILLQSCLRFCACSELQLRARRTVTAACGCTASVGDRLPNKGRCKRLSPRSGSPQLASTNVLGACCACERHESQNCDWDICVTFLYLHKVEKDRTDPRVGRSRVPPAALWNPKNMSDNAINAYLQHRLA